MVAVRAANLGPRQRTRRLVLGVAILAIGIGLVIGLTAAGAPRGWLLAAIIPFWLGALGLIQARERT